MNRKLARVSVVLGMLLASVMAAPMFVGATVVVADPDFSDAVDTMTSTLKANALYAAIAILGVAIIIYLIFWAFGKLKKTAGR